MSISDYKQTIFILKAPTGMDYNEIQVAYIGQGIMGLLLHSLSFCPFCFVRVSVCASVQLEIQIK